MLKNLLLFVSINVSIFSLLHAFPLKMQIKAAEYCDFLNQNKKTDDALFYSQKMGSDFSSATMRRKRSEGHYHYQIIAGREETPIHLEITVDPVTQRNELLMSSVNLNCFMHDQSNNDQSSSFIDELVMSNPENFSYRLALSRGSQSNHSLTTWDALGGIALFAGIAVFCSPLMMTDYQLLIDDEKDPWDPDNRKQNVAFDRSFSETEMVARTSSIRDGDLGVSLLTRQGSREPSLKFDLDDMKYFFKKVDEQRAKTYQQLSSDLENANLAADPQAQKEKAIERFNERMDAVNSLHEEVIKNYHLLLNQDIFFKFNITKAQWDRKIASIEPYGRSAKLIYDQAASKYKTLVDQKKKLNEEDHIMDIDQQIAEAKKAQEDALWNMQRIRAVLQSHHNIAREMWNDDGTEKQKTVLKQQRRCSWFWRFVQYCCFR